MDTCCECNKPIESNQPRDGRYLMEGKTAHYFCSTKDIETEAQRKIEREERRELEIKFFEEETNRAKANSNKRTIVNGHVVLPITGYPGISAMGRSTEWIVCPFCYEHVETYIWSRCGGGKKCGCGAMLCRATAYKKEPA